MRAIFSGHRPDITPAQAIGGAFAAIGPICVLVGLHLSKNQLGALDDLKLVALSVIGADAAVRIGRNLKDGKVEAAAISAPTAPADTTTTVQGAGGDTTKVSTKPAESEHIEGLPAEPPAEEAPLDVDEIESLPPEVSSDPEADAITDLPSDEEELGAAGEYKGVEEVQ